MERHRLACHDECKTLTDGTEDSIDGDVNAEESDHSSQSSHENEQTDSDDSETENHTDGESSSDEESSIDENEDTIWEDLRDLSWTSKLLDTFEKKREELINEGMTANEAYQEAYRHILN